MTDTHATLRRRFSSIILRALCLVLLKGLLIGHTVAQSSATDTKTPAALAPGASAGSYALSGFDNVNLYTGGLNFRLPLLQVGGRGGASYTMTLPIEQKWRVDHTFADQGQHWPNHNWWTGLRPGYGPGVLQGRQMNEGCPEGIGPPIWTMTTLTFTAPDGTEHELRDELTGGNRLESQCFQSYGVGASRGSVFKSYDGSAATFVSDTNINDWTGNVESGPNVIEPTGYLILRDGTRYRIEWGKVMWMRDRNGNQLIFEYNSPYGMTRVTDSLGRQVTVEYDVNDPQYGLCDRISFTGFEGAARKIWIAKTNLGNALRSGYSLQTYANLFPYLTGSSTTQHNPGGIISSVWLPDGRRYQFKYNSYSELARVVLPTGGAFEYDWVEGGGGTICSSMPEIRRSVIERRVYRDGNTLESRMTYSVGGPNVVDSLDASGTRLARSKHYFHSGVCPADPQYPLSHSQWNEGKEYQTEEYAADGVTILRKVNQTWQQTTPSWYWAIWTAEPSNNPKLVTTLTTIEPSGANLVAKQTAINPQTGAVGFDQFNNQTDSWEYDFGAGAPPAHPVRHTHTDYLTTNPVNGINYTATSVHIRSLPRAQQIYSVNPSTGAETLVAQSETKYDETVLSPWYGTVQGWNDPGLYRGNPTKLRRWLDTGGTWIETRAEYDQVGNAVKTWDARNNLAEIMYSATYHHAYPTQTVSPVPDTSGQHGSTTALTTSTVYDFWTGRTTSTTDANNKTTTLSYADAFGNLDPLDRLKSVTRPDGSKTDFNYGDSVGNLYVQTLNDLDATRRTDSFQYFDGLGRAFRAIQYENQDAAKPWITVDTEYDAMGRVAKASLPYRSAGGSTPLTTEQWSNAKRTESEYDAMGRVKKVQTKPDDAVVMTSYAGQYVTVVDQAGKTRRSKTDALGRLVRVDEPDVAGNLGATDAPAQPTSYTYDALGSLRKVEQGGQVRFFMYDSLSRLIRSKNVEQDANGSLAITDAVTGNSQWSFSYGYDANGNITSRTDARGVTSTYAYDNLSRNKTVTYSGGGTSTPAVSHFYDTATNGRGRLHKTESASTAQTTITAYDVMGRPTQSQQKFWVSGAWGQAYTVQQSYNLAGGLTSLIYPSGRSVSYSYDAAGRIGDNGSAAAFSGNLGDGTSRTYASEVRYQEMGGMEQERFGTQTPVYNKRFFNARGQMNEIRVSTYSITAAGQQTNWNRGAILNVYSASPSDGWTASGADNNGNLRKQMVYVPNDDAITGWWDTTFFYDYDQLNRLYQSREVRAGSNYWVQYFDYDRWGNRTINQTNTTGIAPEPQFSVNTVTNRLGVPTGQLGVMTYDAAGNMTLDTYQGGSGSGTTGGTRTYDAENRMTAAQFVSGQLQTAFYTYDGDGRRVKRNMGAAGEVWQVYGMGGELLAEYAPSASPSSPQKEYGYRAGELLVTAEASTSGPLTNVSQGKPATQSSTGWGGDAARAVDGNTSGAWDSGSVSHTDYDAQGWWQVDLQSVQQISRVDFYLMTECCSAHGDFDVKVSDDGASWTDYYVAGPVDSGSVEANRTGRYVRVQLRGTNYLALAEVQVWAGSGGGSAINWLVSDQLGTQRMILDKSGALSGVKRHDYFAFGEEVPGDAVGRISARGYAADTVRQKFTGHERDAETGLDYFIARYYSSVQGRFTSCDPKNIVFERSRVKFLAYLSDPQNWNRYNYVLNNPLLLIDPDGREPNKAQAGTIQQVVAVIKQIEKANPSATRKEILKKVDDHFRGDTSDPVNTRYVYTKENGWIDMKHFFAAANSAANSVVGEAKTILFGLGVEVKQAIEGSTSAFSYEDLPSNAAGAEFGDEEFKPNGALLSTQVENHFENELQATWPELAPNYNALPKEEEGSRSDQSTQDRNDSASPNNARKARGMGTNPNPIRHPRPEE